MNDVGRLTSACILFFATAASAEPSRFIPVELWTGAEWSGKRELVFAPADLTFGEGRKQITGPESWRDPISGKVLQVYRRIHLAHDKVQLFTITQNGQALGRVYDSRRDGSTSGGAKFPLGSWQHGEKRKFEVIYRRSDGRESRRQMTIEILKLDFEIYGYAHCLEYRWTTRKAGADSVIDDNNYTYCPEQGLIEWENN